MSLLVIIRKKYQHCIVHSISSQVYCKDLARGVKDLRFTFGGVINLLSKSAKFNATFFMDGPKLRNRQKSKSNGRAVAVVDQHGSARGRGSTLGTDLIWYQIGWGDVIRPCGGKYYVCRVATGTIPFG